MTLTPELLTRVAGVVLSLFFSYFPWVKDWFEALDSKKKPLVMGVTLLLTSLAIFGVTCGGWYDVGITCDEAGVKSLVEIFILAVIANQATYLIAVRPYNRES